MSRFHLNPKSDSKAEGIANVLKNYLHMPDPTALYTLLGACAANMLEGCPVWLMFVGPPSVGGSELLNTLLGLPGVHEAGLIDSPAAFLSGVGKKDRAKDATGGLLRQVGDHGAVVLKDFTSMLSLPPDVLKKIFGALREMYDGRWTRPIGSDGGRNLSWVGKLAIFAKCTSELDRHHAANAVLGDRWLYYRFARDDPGGFAKGRQALLNLGRNGWQEEVRQKVNDFFESQNLRFGLKRKPRELTGLESSKILGLGKVAATCRSAVVRDNYSHDIIAPPEKELEVRISTELGQLFLGLEYIEVEEKLRWQILRRVALDSMPQLRRIIVEQARAKEKTGGATYEDIRKASSCGRVVVERAVEDLEAHGVVDKHKETRDDGIKVVKVSLTKWMASEYRKGWQS